VFGADEAVDGGAEFPYKRGNKLYPHLSSQRNKRHPGFGEMDGFAIK